jgi:hypothetical protein
MEGEDALRARIAELEAGLTRERFNADARFHALEQDNARLQREAEASAATAREKEQESEALRAALKEVQQEKDVKQQLQRRESLRSVELTQELREQREELVRMRLELARKVLRFHTYISSLPKRTCSVEGTRRPYCGRGGAHASRLTGGAVAAWS